LGQSTPITAVVMAGLKAGEMVVMDGIQRVRPGIAVMPGPASPPPTAPGNAASADATASGAKEAGATAPGAQAAGQETAANKQAGTGH
jgi:membrane fusion protein (multidrug efflux system)